MTNQLLKVFNLSNYRNPLKIAARKFFAYCTKAVFITILQWLPNLILTCSFIRRSNESAYLDSVKKYLEFLACMALLSLSKIRGWAYFRYHPIKPQIRWYTFVSSLSNKKFINRLKMIQKCINESGVRPKISSTPYSTQTTLLYHLNPLIHFFITLIVVTKPIYTNLYHAKIFFLNPVSKFLF